MKRKTILTPFFLDQPLPGLDVLEEPGWIINREHLPEAPVIKRIAPLHAALACYVEEVLSAGDLPVSLAGDCCTALGLLAGLSWAGVDPTLIWFDAHGDFNTPETTPSGFLGGMPLAMLAGLGDQTILEFLEIDPLPRERIILSDARDLDPGERDLVESSGITHLRDTAELLDFSLPDRPLWVHFDTDVLDPAQVPAQNFPAPGGPNKQQLAEVFKRLAGTGLIRAVSLSSWAPNLPGAKQSQEISLELLDMLCE